MRTTVLLLCTLPFSAMAQIDYFNGDPVWHQRSLCNDGGPLPMYCMSDDNFTYSMAGDSTIAGSVYKKLVRTGVDSLYWMGGNGPGCNGATPYGPWSAALLRQDGSMILQWNGNSDDIVHDFDLAIGDTLPLTTTNWNTDITVSGIDSVWIVNDWRKRFLLSSNSWSPYLIEGVGSAHGLLEPVSNFLECGYSLVCFQLDQGQACDFTTTVASVTMDRAALNVFPVPTGNVLNIVGERSLGLVQLFDPLGRAAIRLDVRSAQVQLDVQGLPTGTYLLNVGGTTRRVSVQR